FLTNEKTKKEVVCQVVKSKSDGNSVGYVELRFTEPAPGFWGMRFPSDTVLPQAVARPAGPPVAPAVPKVAPPAPPALPVASVAPKPVAPAGPFAGKPVPPATPPTPLTLSDEPLLSLLNSRPFFEAKGYPLPQEEEPAPPAPLPVVDAKPVLPSAPVSSSNPTTEELKQQAARLQEQLSSLLFTEPSKPASAGSFSSAASQSSLNLSEVAKQVSDTAAQAKEPAAASSPAKNVAPSTKPASASSPEEELQIPAWLAPLARETDGPPSKPSPMATASSLPVLPEAPAEVE